MSTERVMSMSDDTSLSNEDEITNLALLQDDKIANGIYNALKPTVQAIDSNIKNVLDSQAELAHRLETLESAMVKFQEIQSFPELSQYSQKINTTRKRLHDITLYINRLNARIASMRTTIEKKEAHRMKARAATLAALEKVSPDHPALSSPPVKSQVIDALHWDEDKVQKQ